MQLLNKEYIRKRFPTWGETIINVCVSTPDKMDSVIYSMEYINNIIYGKGVKTIATKKGEEIYLMVECQPCDPTIFYNIALHQFEASTLNHIMGTPTTKETENGTQIRGKKMGEKKYEYEDNCSWYGLKDGIVLSVKDPHGSGITLEQDSHGAITVQYPDGRSLTCKGVQDIDIGKMRHKVCRYPIDFHKTLIPTEDITWHIMFTAWVKCHFMWVVGVVEERVKSVAYQHGMINCHFITEPIPKENSWAENLTQTMERGENDD